jgi:hypothetical protein
MAGLPKDFLFVGPAFVFLVEEESNASTDLNPA